MDWSDLLIYDTTLLFAVEILIRCVIMFIMIVLFLRLTGKRGVRQLSSLKSPLFWRSARLRATRCSMKTFP